MIFLLIPYLLFPFLSFAKDFQVVTRLLMENLLPFISFHLLIRVVKERQVGPNFFLFHNYFSFIFSYNYYPIFLIIHLKEIQEIEDLRSRQLSSFHIYFIRNQKKKSIAGKEFTSHRIIFLSFLFSSLSLSLVFIFGSEIY